MIKKILINIFLLMIIFLFLDFCIYIKLSPKYPPIRILKNYCIYYKEIFSAKTEKDLKRIFLEGKYRHTFYRSVINKDSPLSPVLIFGCSYAFGIYLQDEDTFSAILSRYTKRPVYNRSHPGLGSALMLYQLSDEDFYKIVPEPKYIIYTYIHEHQLRLFGSCIFKPYFHYLYYTLKDNKLVRTKNHRRFISVEYLFNVINKCLRNSDWYIQKTNDLMEAQLLECNRLIKQHWPNSQFIIFVYTANKYSTIEAIKSRLEKHGIKIILRKDIAPFDDFDERYTLSKTDQHPNRKAWEYITPKLLEAIESK